MERLNLSSPPEFSAQEASIHLARYAAIMPYVRDKVVLDIACGEGYGAALMMRAGARRVVGVDISSEAIEKSKNLFSDSKAEYVQADAGRLEELFGSATFDVVVSIETIEHVADDEVYLRVLKNVAKPGAIFLITCPNDYWYYPSPEQSNPFHLRKYRLDDFRSISQKILGKNVKWGLGSAIFGFGAAPIDEEQLSRLCDSWMKIDDVQTSFVTENRQFGSLCAENCSYFLGLWNVEAFSYGAAYYGVSMDAYTRMFDALAYDSVKSLREALEGKGQQLRNKSLLLKAVQSENEVMRENISALSSEINRLSGETSQLRSTVAEMEVGYWRYRRLSEKVPAPLRKGVINFVRFFKRWLR